MHVFGEKQSYGLIKRFAVVVLPACLSLVMSSCDQPTNASYSIVYSGDIWVTVSVTTNPLQDVHVIEFESGNVFDQLFNDSITARRPFIQSDYTNIDGYTGFIYRRNRNHAPDYSQFAACKQGYKIWRWSLELDTVVKISKHSDDLRIKMVKK